jgi:hypothetical protein
MQPCNGVATSFLRPWGGFGTFERRYAFTSQCTGRFVLFLVTSLVGAPARSCRLRGQESGSPFVVAVQADCPR